ncbi:MAG: GNAT family N-acetyltransferase [Gemmatimonadales bacterium]|jgi:ribosomal protein S18 acetylase RimI-like enzyme
MTSVAQKRGSQATSVRTFEWRAPGPEDRPRVAQAVAATGMFRPDEVDVALEVFDDYCQAPGQDYHALAAYGDSGELAGFAFFGPTPCTVGTWDLYWIVVHPQAQGRGAGRGLLERAEAQMCDAGGRMCVIETSSRDDYEATRRFYRACGYEEVARIADFYDAGDDRVTYAKQFEKSLSLRKENE